MVAITIDGKQMEKLVTACAGIREGVPKVLAPAINRTLDKGRTEVKRGIRKQYLIKYSDIPISIKGANAADLNGQVILQDRMLFLNKFTVRPRGVQRRKNKVAVFAQVKRGGGGTMPGAFVPANVGYVGPFIRAHGAKRLPMHKLLTISAPIMATQAEVGPEVNKAMGDTLAKRIDHELKRVLRGHY